RCINIVSGNTYYDRSECHERWMEQVNGSQLFVEWGMVLVKVIAIVISYFIVKSVGQRATEKGFQRKYKTETRSSSRRRTLQSIVSNVFTYFILFIMIGIVFELFGLDIKALLAGAGIVGLAIGFGAQGLVSDVVTGFFILLEKQMDVDDYVTVAGYDGIIVAFGLCIIR